ncbi:MAG: hypothetical protein ACKVWR_14925 [Acidimicrobiales bacterium]
MRRISAVIGALACLLATALFWLAAPAAQADPPTLPQFLPYGECTARVTDWSPLQGSVTVQGVAGCPTQWWVLMGLACAGDQCFNPQLGPDWGETPWLPAEWPIFSVTGAETKTVTFARMRCAPSRFIQMDLVALLQGPNQPVSTVDSPSEHDGPLGMGGGDTPTNPNAETCQEITTTSISVTTTTQPPVATSIAQQPTTTAAPTTSTAPPAVEVAGRQQTLPATGAGAAEGASTALGVGLLLAGVGLLAASSRRLQR